MPTGAARRATGIRRRESTPQTYGLSATRLPSRGPNTQRKSDRETQMSSAKKEMIRPKKKPPTDAAKPKINPIRVLGRYPFLIGTCTVLAAAFGYLVHIVKPPVFQASA